MLAFPQIHYNPVPDLGKRDVAAEPLPEVVRRSPEVDSAHARERREVRGSISVNLNFPVTIVAFQVHKLSLHGHSLPKFIRVH